MKRFNPENEINKNQNNSFIYRAFIPMLVLACVCMAMIGITFSYKLAADDKIYKVDLEVFDGEMMEYHFEGHQGEFSHLLVADGELQGIDCKNGYVEYDQFTGTVKIPYLNTDTKCSIFFRERTDKYLSVDGMSSVNDNDGVSYYYRGDATNNYLKFNGMLFRIIRINGDGTLRIMLDDNSNFSSFGDGKGFLNSNVKSLLDEWFNDNFKDNDMVVTNDFDINRYSVVENDTLVNLDIVYEGNVGLLSAKEAAFILDSSKGSYLGDILLMNETDSDKILVVNGYNIEAADRSREVVIKPVINIKNVDLDGFGTIDNPYELKED